jgi:hypothetical protein
MLEPWECHRIIPSPPATRAEALLEKAMLGWPVIRRYKEASQASRWSHCVSTYQVTPVQQGAKSVSTKCVGTKLKELNRNDLTGCETNVNAYKQLYTRAISVKSIP